MPCRNVAGGDIEGERTPCGTSAIRLSAAHMCTASRRRENGAFHAFVRFVYPQKKAPETCARDFFGAPAGKRFEHERLLDSRKIGDYRPGYVVFELRNLKQSFSGRFCVPNNCRFLFHFCI